MSASSRAQPPPPSIEDAIATCSTPTAGAADESARGEKREVKVALVVDRKTAAKYQKQREMAISDVESVVASLNYTLQASARRVCGRRSTACFQCIEYNHLDFSETTACDAFSTADIAIVEFTITTNQPTVNWRPRSASCR